MFPEQLFSLLSSFIILLSCMQTLADELEKKLVHELLDNYDKRIRPTPSSSQALNVTFGLALAQIIDVDEKNQIITTNCWLNQVWIDYQLTWDPALYNNITLIHLPFDSIWLPDILLYNNADVSSSKTSSVSTNVMISHTGNVTWLSTVIYRSSCAVDVRYFPFDEQNCTMKFASWTYDGSQLNPVLIDERGDLSNYVKSSEFDLLGMYVQRNIIYYSCCPFPYPDITYYIHIKRRPLFYVFNMLLPCCLITLVALLGFYIPSDSGEKVTMGITTLLSMTVFLMLVTEAMPPTSDHLPLIGIYYFITIGIVSLATAMTVFTLNIHHKGTGAKFVPRWIQFVCFQILARILCVPIEYPDSDYSASRKRTMSSSGLHTSDSLSNRKRKRGTSNASRNNMEMHERLINSSSGKLCDDNFDEKNMKQVFMTSPVNGHLMNPVTQPAQYAIHKPNIDPNNPWIAMEDAHPYNQQNSEKLDAHFTKVLKTISESIIKNEKRLVEQDKRDDIKLQWQQVALVMDRLLLTIFVTLTVGVTLGLGLQSTMK